MQYQKGEICVSNEKGGSVRRPGVSKLINRTKKDALAVPTQTTRELLRIVRAAQPIPRVAVARRLGVHRRRVTVIVKPLIDSGVLREGTAEPTTIRRVGRPAVGLSLRSEAEYLIGVNIGVSLIRMGTANVDGSSLSHTTLSTPAAPEIALAQIRTWIESERKKMADRELRVVGISVPGPTDLELGKLLYAPHLGWRNVPITELLRSHAEVLVENNATAAAIYEARRRRAISATRNAGDFVLVRAGTGIGVGLVLDGEVYRGTTGGDIAGEFGHMTIVAGGKQCLCGNLGCWERYASTASAVELYAGDSPRSSFRSKLTFDEIVKRAVAGERRAEVTLKRVGSHLGIGIGNVICGLGVPDVVLSGDLVHAWKFIEEPARAAIDMSLCGRLSQWSLQAGDARGSELGGALEVAIEHYLLSLARKSKVAA